MMGEDFENPWGLKTPKGKTRMMSSLLRLRCIPWYSRWTIRARYCCKAIAFGEALTPEYDAYVTQVQKNAQEMAKHFLAKGYEIISGGTDNHMMLIDLRSKNLTGKIAENTLIKADITINKNMVPFDDKSPFVTSGMRVGTAAVTTRGLKEADMGKIVDFIDRVLMNHENEEEIAKEKQKLMSGCVNSHCSNGN